VSGPASLPAAALRQAPSPSGGCPRARAAGRSFRTYATRAPHDDFELYEDGKRQTILGFDAIDLAQKATPPHGDPDALNPAARRHFLILFDLSFAQPKSVVAARRAAKEFVLSQMGDRDFAAVATYSVEKGVRLLVTFSQDRVQLARAIDTLGIVEAVNLASDPLAFMYDAMAAYFGGSPLGTGQFRESQASGLLDSMQTLATIERARLDQAARARVTRLTQSLDGLARALDAVSGRKDILYLSEGFESRLLVGTKDSDIEHDWIISGEQWKVDVEKRFGSTHLQTEINSLTDIFRRTDCVIHAVDIAGLQTNSDGGSLTAARGENALFEIANATGGEVLRNDNDFKAQIARLIARTNLVYVLAFRPAKAGRDDRYHELKVKVHAPGAHVSARAGYYEKKPFRSLSPLERSLSAADLIANEVPLSDIRARVLAAAHPGEKLLASVPVLVDVPGDTLLAGQKGNLATVEIYAYAHDAENRVRDFFAQTVNLDLAVMREKLERGGLRYYGELALPSGDYRLRVLVRNAETGRLGLTVEPLHVPDFSGRPPYLAPPIFLEKAQTGVFIRGRSRIEPTRADVLLQPPGGDFVPVALAEVTPESPARLSVIAYNFGDPPAGELKIGAQVLSSEGRPLGPGEICVLGKSALDGDGKQVLLVSFQPAGLAPGRYALRVFLQDASTGRGGQAPASAEDLEKRLERARRHAESAVPATPAGRKVAAELGEIGAAYLTRGGTGRAIELLEEAYGWDADNGLVLAQLTLAYVRSEEFPFARLYLELAEERAPRAPPEAYAVLGEVYYALNRLEDAVVAWEHFERLGGGDPRTLRRLVRAREELALTSKQNYSEIGDFVFYFDSFIPAEKVNRIAERLAASSRELGAFFGERLSGPQVVILYAGRVYFALVSIPEWVSGVFDGKIRVAVDPGGSVTPELETVLAHELAHAYIRFVSGDRAPGWLHEGLAQWFEGKRILRGEFREAFAHQAVHTLSEMEGNLAHKAEHTAARSNYVEALGLTEYLMQERGPGAIACLVRELGEASTLEQALRSETGLTPSELLDNWRGWAGLRSA
jgi:VWFA-related protein